MPRESDDTPSPPGTLSTDPCRLMVDNTQHFLSLLDLDGTVVEVNQRVLELRGLTRDQVIGHPSGRRRCGRLTNALALKWRWFKP